MHSFPFGGPLPTTAKENQKDQPTSGLRPPKAKRGLLIRALGRRGRLPLKGTLCSAEAGVERKGLQKATAVAAYRQKEHHAGKGATGSSPSSADNPRCDPGQVSLGLMNTDKIIEQRDAILEGVGGCLAKND